MPYVVGNAPFLRIILPAVAGVAAARLLVVPAAVAVACCAVVFACAIAARNKPWSDIYTWAFVAIFFFAVSTLRAPQRELPHGGRVEMVAQVSENPYTRGRWRVTTATVGHYREGGGAWRGVDETIELLADTCYQIAVGDQLALRGWVNPVDSADSSYGRLMRLRGRHSRVYLTPGNLIRTAPHTSKTPAYYASRIQDAAVERLRRLDLDPAAMGVVTAMAAGERRGVERSVRGAYSATGAAHLLAVSGLHVGIVFILVNLLLCLLHTLHHRAHIYKNLAAVAAIWLYAVAAGLSPSVVRATIMFSFAQLALASGSARNGLNIMLGSAVVMLALNPNYWGDPSFMLSYAAVLSIAAFFPALYRLVRSRHRALNAVSSVMIVGITASLGTAPLVAYWFGHIPLAGMVINPVVIVTAHVIVMFGVVWMAAPVGALNAPFSAVLDAAAGLQNAVVGWSAGLPWGSVPAEGTPLWAVIAIYCGYAALAVWLSRSGRKPNKHLLKR